MKKTMQEPLEFGIINIDKSSGPTSFNVSEFVKKKLGLRKTSHFGTLDPKVTGVLPVALNRACKLTGHFLGEDKEYVGVMRIHEDISMNDIKKVIKKKFLGEILQTPPVKSRVKRQERTREVYYFELLEQDGKDILFKTKVQGGTYIRKLIDDLGKELGIGAHMLELRRVSAGIFDESTMVNLYDFEKAVDEFEKGDEKALRKMILPAEDALKKIYDFVEVEEKEIKSLWEGKPLLKKHLVKEKKFEKDEVFCVFSGEKFVGIFKAINSGDILGKSEFVMQPIR